MSLMMAYPCFGPPERLVSTRMVASCVRPNRFDAINVQSLALVASYSGSRNRQEPAVHLPGDPQRSFASSDAPVRSRRRLSLTIRFSIASFEPVAPTWADRVLVDPTRERVKCPQMCDGQDPKARPERTSALGDCGRDRASLLMRHRRSSLPWRVSSHSREEAIRRGAYVPG